MIGLCLEGNRVNERLGNPRDDINDSRRQIGRLTLLPRDPKTASGHILTVENKWNESRRLLPLCRNC